MVVGGMDYYVDPNMEYPSNHLNDKDCSINAKSLLKCINLNKLKIKSVDVRKINIDICFDD